MELETLKKIVWNILDKKEGARNDDFVLYANVCKEIGIDLNMELGFFLLDHIRLQAPPFGSVSRCRRKWQEKHPELVDNKTKEIREQEEEKYIKLSKEK